MCDFDNKICPLCKSKIIISKKLRVEKECENQECSYQILRSGEDKGE